MYMRLPCFLPQKVIKVLESQSEPGGLHENTLLLVMGDHGQTLNGDHGGGSAEEVYYFSCSQRNLIGFFPTDFWKLKSCYAGWNVNFRNEF